MATQSRSPAYPRRSIEEAIGDVGIIWDKCGKSIMTENEVAQALGHKGLGGAAKKRLGPLKQYGLIEKSGKGWGLSSVAVTIAVRSPDSTEYGLAVLSAFREVGLFVQLDTDFVDSSKQLIQAHLIEDLDFTNDGAMNAAQTFLASKEYIETLKLSDTKKNQKESKNGSKMPTSKLSIGDAVQWTSQGVAQFPSPRLIQGFSDDHSHAFVENEKSGFPIEQLSVVKKYDSKDGTFQPPINPFIEQSSDLKQELGAKRDVYGLPEGDLILIWPKRMSNASYEEAVDWLDLIKRKLSRCVSEEDLG